MNKTELKKKALEILELKKEIEEMNKKYDKLEKILLENINIGDNINTKLGEVTHSSLSRRFIDPTLYYGKVDIEKFINSVSVKISCAEKNLAQDDIEQISEIKIYDKLNVVLRKVPVKVA